LKLLIAISRTPKPWSAWLALLPIEIQSDIQFFGQFIWQELLFFEDIGFQGQPYCIARLFRVRNKQP
jgi:hypothetical protein